MTMWKADAGGPAELSFAMALESVFFATPFIAGTDPLPPTDNLEVIHPAQWQLAAGRRLLTPDEEAARAEYFRHKINSVLDALR